MERVDGSKVGMFYEKYKKIIEFWIPESYAYNSQFDGSGGLRQRWKLYWYRIVRERYG